MWFTNIKTLLSKSLKVNVLQVYCFLVSSLKATKHKVLLKCETPKCKHLNLGCFTGCNQINSIQNTFWWKTINSQIKHFVDLKSNYSLFPRWSHNFSFGDFPQQNPSYWVLPPSYIRLAHMQKINLLHSHVGLTSMQCFEKKYIFL